MTTRFAVPASPLARLSLVPALPAQPRTFPVDELRPAWSASAAPSSRATGSTSSRSHILGVLRNVIGPRRNLILARLEGGPLAKTGVIAGMSGSPVYIDGRLVGAVSYSLGQFSTEPIAGITPIAEMIEAATLPAPRRQAARVELPMPLTQRRAARVAAAGVRVGAPVRRQPVRRAGVRRRRRSNAGIGTMLRPIATPLTMGGFDAGGDRSGRRAFRDSGFLPVMAGGGAGPRAAGAAAARRAAAARAIRSASR